MTDFWVAADRAATTGEMAVLRPLYLPECGGCQQTFSEVEAVVNRGERLRGGGVTLRSTNVSGEKPKLRVLATLSAKSGDLVDKAGSVTHHLPAVPPAEWVFELRLVDGRWLLTYADKVPG